MRNICEKCGEVAKVKGFCQRHYSEDWRRKSKEKYNEYQKKYRKDNDLKSIKYMHKNRFGGLRNRVLKRDNHTCQMCGMTNEEHKEKWNCEITIDHLDNQGRHSDKKNHTLNNLWVLCLSCHGRKDQRKAREFDELPLSSQKKILNNLKYTRKWGD